MPKSVIQSHMNYSSLEPVLFEKLHNIKLSPSVTKVTTFFQFDSTKAALLLQNILLHYTHDCDDTLKTLYSELVTNNDFDNKSYDVKTAYFKTYLALLQLCSDEITDCKFKITQ